MKKIFLIVSLGLFLGAASESAEAMTNHKTTKTEHVAANSAVHKGTHKKVHKKGQKHASKSGISKEGAVNQ